MRIALAGNPNSGKTTMYNALTGRNEKVGNWAGVTVEKKEHPIKKAYYGGEEQLIAVDLPGAYSMSPFTSEESITSAYVKHENPDVIINIVDATNLSRSLFFTTQLLELGIPVVPVPGASACVTALAVSGQPTARFVFEGFLPVPRRARAQRLESLKREERTVIFYEAPHKLRGTLADLAGAFGEQRSLTLCRELTKLHEEIFKTTIGGAMARYAEEAPRGEFVLVMAGAAPEETEETPPTLEEAVAAARALMAQGQSASAAAKAAAAQSPFGKGEIYRLLCREEGDE